MRDFRGHTQQEINEADLSEFREFAQEEIDSLSIADFVWCVQTDKHQVYIEKLLRAEKCIHEMNERAAAVKFHSIKS